jgi:hypothetical protein
MTQTATLVPEDAFYLDLASMQLDFVTVDAWLALFGGAGFNAQRTTEGTTFVLTTM